MKQLSAHDASFIYMESPATPMHIGSLCIYDGTDIDPDRITEESIQRHMAERLHLNAATRRRLVRVPMEADYPYWIEDRNFDLEYHVRRVALPRPGDRAALQKLASRIFARPLDMTKPLWELYIIEGLDNVDGIAPDSFALLSKTHHAAVDGASGLHFLEMLHDLEPDPPPIPLPERTWRPEPYPSDAELLFRSSVNHLTQPMRAFEAANRHFQQQAKLSGAGEIFKQLRKSGAASAAADRSAPRTRFNGAVSPHREIGAVVADLEDIKRIRKLVEGATINDAVLAICGGALRRYLESKNELDTHSLVAMAPVSLRAPGDTAGGGNRVSALFVGVGSHIADPLERLRFVQQDTSSSKLMHHAVGAANMTDYTEFVPAFTAAMASRLIAQTAANAPAVPFNVSITNIPGPQQPLYFCGAPMVTMIGLGPVSQGMGIIFPIMSYCGRVSISFTTCRDMVPDPQFFETCINESITEMLALTKPKTKAKSKAKTKSKTEGGQSS